MMNHFTKRLFFALLALLLLGAGCNNAAVKTHLSHPRVDAEDEWAVAGLDDPDPRDQPTQAFASFEQPTQPPQQQRQQEFASPTPPVTTQPAMPQPQAAEPVQEQLGSSAGGGVNFITGAPQHNVYALIVGIEDYRSVTPTPGARADAEAFAEMLRTSMGVPEHQIHLLTDGDATRADIYATLSWMQRNVSSDGRIFFFFSGHGSPNIETGQSFLLPFEGQPETIEFSGIALHEVLDGLEQTPAREVLAFVDACFSGSGDRSALPEGSRPLVPVQEETAQERTKVAIIASSGASEISGTTEEGDAGLFTYHLIRALGEGRADMDGDGMISLEELQSYITPRVSRDARRLNREQSPTISIADGLPGGSNLMLMWGLPRD